MSDPSFRPLNLGDTQDDDAQVLDSLFVATDTPPTPVVEPITTPVLVDPPSPTRLLSVRQSVDPSWTTPTLLLPEDTRRQFLTVSVSETTEEAPRFISPADPGIGVNNIQVAVPAGEYWELLSARFTLSTSAAAGGRAPLLNLLSPDGVTYLTVSSGLSYTTVSSSRAFNWWVGGICSNGSDNLGGNGLPNDLILAPGSIVRLSIGGGGMDAGDTMYAATFSYRRIFTDSGIVLRSDTGGTSGLAIVEAGKTVSLYNHTGPVRVSAIGSAPVVVNVWSVTR